ncbi:dihydroorotate dehydrogenase-like protein [Porphyromonadaceae bacterium W3.11]|nr:dihydroorotate dehydrogenase-like protein [Porphyromonadaceae bacterium W3.11]
MADISTLYAKKLKLQSPFIVASSGLTQKTEKIKEFANAGAGAIILKSIFEEQLEQEINYMSEGSGYPEAMEYLNHYVKSHALQEHIDLIKQCRNEVDVPIIASINCYKADSWLDYAGQLIDAGAAALELNVMNINTDMRQDWGAAEATLTDLVRSVRKQMPNTPITLKLSKYYTNIIRLANDLYSAGADGLVLFNRSYMPDIDIERETIINGAVFSDASDYSNSLRYAALIHGGVRELSLSLSTGARDGKDLIKGILAGADAVQYCTALYKGGSEVIRKANVELNEWMDKKQYHNIGEIKGRLAATRVDHANLYERSQFMKYYAGNNDARPTDVMSASSQNDKSNLPY